MPRLYNLCRLVSIHAPARGATMDYRQGQVMGSVSIHAPARGATDYIVVMRTPGEFQSTPPRGGRL